MTDNSPEDEFKELSETLLEYKTPSLMVNVEFLDLIEHYGEEEAWVVLGKLKDLLG